MSRLDGPEQCLPVEQAVALANRYFEIVGDAVETHGGEILKFLGDGVLAIFPTGDDSLDATAVREAALAAAQRALHTAQHANPPLGFSFGVRLHFGEVRYGNIGSKTRIDFTVLGQAVNTAARIEGLCSQFDQPVLFSQDFANRLSRPTTLMAEATLKGLDGTSKVLGVTEDL